jgi:hypothetical protein
VRKKIVLCCDGLLSNFAAGVLLVVEEVTGKKFYPADVIGHDFGKVLDLSAGETAAVANTIASRRGFVLGLRPYPRARHGVRCLRELGDVACVAPRDLDTRWREERESWLALHVGIDHVHHVDNFDESECDVDVFVSAVSEHVREWLIAWPGRTAVFWRTLHNGGELLPRGAHLIGSWEVLYQVVRDGQRACGQVEVIP